MRKYLVLTCLSCASLLNAFSLRDQGYFDIGVGPEMIEKTEIQGTTTEYSPGPSLKTSVGLAYKNGLGLAISWKFNYHNVKAAYTNAGPVTNDDDAKEFTNYSAGLDFVYKLLPSSDVAFFFNGGPCFVVNTDQKLLSTATSTPDESTIEITADGDGNVTQTVTTTKTDQEQAADPYEFRENISFGYQVGGGVEYRQDNHKALLVHINYLKSHIYQSTYNSTTSEVESSAEDDLEGFSGSIALRYYL